MTVLKSQNRIGTSSTEKKYQDLLTKITEIESKINQIESKIHKIEADFRWFYLVPISTIILQIVTIAVLFYRGQTEI